MRQRLPARQAQGWLAAGEFVRAVAAARGGGDLGRERIRYLNREERERTRVLYEACFPEDSAEFVDYYYREKAAENQILITEGQCAAAENQILLMEGQCTAAENQILLMEGQCAAAGGSWPEAMLHLNPFLFRFGSELCQLNYIVAVATAPAVRGQGKMARLMAHALQDMARQGQPFTFLMPANPDVYRSSGFTFVPEGQGEADAAFVSEGQGESDGAAFSMGEAGTATFSSERGDGFGEISLRPATDEDIPGLIAYSNRLLAERYEIYPTRDEEYFRRLFRELAAQQGDALVAVRKTDLVGLVTYGREGDSAEAQHFLTEPALRRQIAERLREYLPHLGVRQIREAKMPFMARILNLPRMMELFGAACGVNFRLRVCLTDHQIAENNGCFELWSQDGAGGVSAIPRGQAGRQMDVGQLTEHLFSMLRLYIREWV